MQDTVHRFLPDGHPKTGLEPASGVPASAFTTDDHTELRHKVFETADGSITAGVWECAPIRVNIEAYSSNELMTVLSGRLTLTYADGKKETFTTGDTFLVSKGTKMTLEITEKLRKYYMIVK